MLGRTACELPLGYTDSRRVTSHTAAFRVSGVVSALRRGVALERLGTKSATASVCVFELALARTTVGISAVWRVWDALLIFRAGGDSEAAGGTGLGHDGRYGQDG